MTHAATYSTDYAPTEAEREGVRLWPTFVVALIGVLLISLPTIADPLIRHDDYPAFFAEPDAFWPKTLHEGRWVNYLWHLREIVTPAWLNFAVYQALWALFAAAIGVVAMGRDGSPWFAAVLALIVLVAPSASLIALWFNTLIPGLALVALYAALGCTLSVRTHRALLPLFVTLTFLAYTTYPLLLLAVCLARTYRRSFLDLFGLLSLFTTSFVLAVLTAFAINWQVHGVFGVPPAEWREGTPAADLNGLITNIPLILQSFAHFFDRSTFDFQPALFFHIALFGGATLVLVKRARLEALYLHAGLWMGIALIVVQVLKLGVITPPRAFIFAWVFYALIVVRAAIILHRDAADHRQITPKLLLLVAAFHLQLTFMQFSTHRDWQSDTQAIAERVSAVQGQIYLTGKVSEMDSARKAFIQKEIAILERIRQLTGRTVMFCNSAPDACETAKGENPERVISIN
ncbi:MAG: hypothetical protein HKN30_03440 [Sulfitobacter sp.]|nr:hypothetical protein [Sulfitobacter sp.]